MSTSQPSTLKGPRLTLLVGGAAAARRDPATLQVPVTVSSIQTPSSTTVEYGDHVDLDMTAAEKANHIFKMWLSSGRIEESVNEAQAQDSHSDAPPVTPVIRKPRPANTKLVNDRLGRFLSGLSQATGDPNKELVQENKGLHQRVAVLQRTEQQLSKDNQDLNSHVLSLQQSQEAQQRRFEDELRLKQAPLEAKIRELEQQIAHQNERLFKLTLQPKPVPASPPKAPRSEPNTSIASTMTDADVASWFATRGASWAAWVDEFAHDNPNRLAELHPLQQSEILGNIEHFVRLTDDRQLPEPLASSPSLNVTRLLLRGMLSDFIVTETLASPFWVFEALTKKEPLDHSPPTSRPNPRGASPPGFSMDDAMWNSTGFAPCPSPYNVPPAPTTARSISMLSPRHGPPQVSPISLTINTKGLLRQYRLPAKPEIEDVMTLLMRTQQNDDSVYEWRAHLMQMLSDGGISRDASHPSMANNEDKQMLASTRREYARLLKERFLSGSARYFLRDQDPQGIAKLEGQLVSELDLALRFSAQVWARRSPMHFIGLAEIAGSSQDLQFDPEVMIPHINQRTSANRDQQVVMVLQPAIGTLRKIGSEGQVWRKAEVVVTSTNAQRLASLQQDIMTPITAVETSSLPFRLAPDIYRPMSPPKPMLSHLKPVSTASKRWLKEEHVDTPRPATPATRPDTPSSRPGTPATSQ
ncbi:hypothetical protein QBC34DRAFT_297719 [Podospora aff. communis PSN243]|uniref:Uncharacterized protein n=1 Tax=Podospora aff. communis PSN243 TaxID=3040156 RepID=A0AAV9GP51_9PEZI|nr:hypothetical protein QBC34DRAFT_297719 [Podospora aff. communis PSN243]